MLTIRGWVPQEPKKPKTWINVAKTQSSQYLKLCNSGRFLLTILVSIAILIIILFIIMPPISGSSKEQSGFLDLTSGDVGKLHSFAKQGSKIKLDVSIQGVDKGIGFYMTDYKGEIVFDGGRIYDEQQIEWTASSDGVWFVFDNEVSLSSVKNIFYSISIREVPRPIFSAAGVGLSILSGLLLMYRKKDTILSWGIEEQESLGYLPEHFDSAFDESQEY